MVCFQSVAVAFLELYQRLLKPRMIEEKMLILLRQGKISKWFSGMVLSVVDVFGDVWVVNPIQLNPIQSINYRQCFREI